MRKTTKKTKTLQKSNVTDKDLDNVLSGLIEKGIIKEEIIDGEPHYLLTSVGEIIMGHVNSDAKTQN